MNSENNNDLNAISLGSVDNSNNLNTNPVGPVPPVSPVVNEEIPTPISTNEGQNTIGENTVPVMPEVPATPVSPVEPIAPVAFVEPVAPLEPINPEPSTEPIITPEAPTNNDMFSAIPNNNIGTVPPMADNSYNVPVAPVATMPSTPVEPVAPVPPLQYDVPDTINNISSVPVFNDIGTVPPIPDIPVQNVPQNVPKKKKGINKGIFILIILVSMAAVGVGVYMFLHISNSKASPVITKKVEIEVGSAVSSLITDYATFKGIDSSNCSLNITEITDTKVLNKEYPFTITCNETVYRGTAKIVDTVKPEVTLKNVNVSLNNEVKPEDFIATCKDNTTCSYEFVKEDELKQNITKAGTYEVPIKVKDEANNEIEVNGSLTVTENIAELYLVCSKGNDTLMEANKLGIANNTFNKFNTRSYTFKLSAEEYQALKTESTGKTDVTYKGITGRAEFRDTDNTLILSKELTYEDLNKEANAEIPLDFAGLKAFYTEKGYTCNPVY